MKYELLFWSYCTVKLKDQTDFKKQTKMLRSYITPCAIISSSISSPKY